MAKKVKVLAIVILVVCLVTMLSACQLKYAEPDSLGMANASVGQRIWIGLQVAFLGIVTVFIVLFLLILFINLLKEAFKLPELIKKLKDKKIKDEPVGIKDEAVNIKDVAVDSEDEEVVAAITAALIVYYDTQANYKSNVKFRVRSIKEIK